MKMRRPRTLLGLVLLGLAFVTVPLLIAIGNAVLKLGQLATESEAVLGDSATATLQNEKLVSLLTSMERNARQYLQLQGGVASASELLNFYDGDQASFEESLAALTSLPKDPDIAEQLRRLASISKEVHWALRSGANNGSGASSASGANNPAIDMIIEQGEAPSATHPDAHFVVFDTIRKEYSREVESARARGEAFDPVRRVVSNPMTRFHEDPSGGTVIADPLTHKVAELFNISYDTMLLMLLRFLAQHRGRVFTRQALLERAWGYQYAGGTRTVDIHVRRLRAKLGQAHGALIATVRHVGYKMKAPAARP